MKAEAATKRSACLHTVSPGAGHHREGTDRGPKAHGLVSSLRTGLALGLVWAPASLNGERQSRDCYAVRNSVLVAHTCENLTSSSLDTCHLTPWIFSFHLPRVLQKLQKGLRTRCQGEARNTSSHQKGTGTTPGLTDPQSAPQRGALLRLKGCPRSGCRRLEFGW